MGAGAMAIVAARRRRGLPNRWRLARAPGSPWARRAWPAMRRRAGLPAAR